MTDLRIAAATDTKRCLASQCVYEARYQILHKRDDYLWRGIECGFQIVPHDFDGEWLHDGQHLICKICGRDET